MPNDFIPLIRPAAPAKSNGNGFAPLALKILPQPNNQPDPAETVHEPSIALQREGDKVTAIHIECSCGQVIDLACEYC